MKYYWYSFHIYDLGLNVQHFHDLVTTNHPFEEVSRDQKAFAKSIVTLINWKEISKKEYDLYLDLDDSRKIIKKYNKNSQK